MRTLLVGTMAATLVGCSCLLPPQSVMDACIDANGLACFDRTIASQPIELKPASFKANSATKKAKIAAKMEKPRSRRWKSFRLMTTATSTISPRKRRNPPWPQRKSSRLRHPLSLLSRPIRSLPSRRRRARRRWKSLRPMTSAIKPISPRQRRNPQRPQRKSSHRHQVTPLNRPIQSLPGRRPRSLRGWRFLRLPSSVK